MHGGRNARISTAQTAASTRTASEMQRGLGRSSRGERLILKSWGMVWKGCLQILHDKPEAGTQVLEKAVVIPDVNLQARVPG